jgi:hypothetical protein
MGKLKLGSWAVILREEFEKWVLDLSGNVDGRRDVKTVGSNVQMQMNSMKMREERSVVSHWKMKEEWGKKNINPVALLFRLGIKKFRGNRKVPFYTDILNIAVELRPFLLVTGRMDGESGVSRLSQYILLN